MNIQKEMIKRGYSMKNYALSRELDYDTLKKVIYGKYDGKRKGQARECVEALYRDGLLPPHHPMHDKIAGVA